MRPVPDPPLPGQESVWAFPRPARAEAITQHLRIEYRGETVAETRAAIRTIETSHPPSFYFPPADVRARLSRSARPPSLCEWKGEAIYWDVAAGGQTLAAAAWSYPRPTHAFAALAGYIAFYAAPFDGCFVDGERVVAQPGGFYGGWVTSHVAGPFKGVPGSRFW